MLQLAKSVCPLTEDEACLVTEAIALWHDPNNFPDDKVAQVKQLFRRVFSLHPETTLVGSAVRDAVILSSPMRGTAMSSQRFFAIVQMPDTWECNRLDTDCFISFSDRVGFVDLIRMLDASTSGPVVYVFQDWLEQSSDS